MTVLFNLIFPNDFAFSYTRLTLSIAPLSHILIYPYFPKALSNSAIQPSVFSPTSQLSLLIFLFSFFLFIVVIICYTWWFFLFFSSLFSYHTLGLTFPGHRFTVKFALQVKFSPTESEVCLWQVKFHLWWSCGGKSIYFFVCPCLYHKLGDLSTTLEMTVLFL